MITKLYYCMDKIMPNTRPILPLYKNSSIFQNLGSCPTTWHINSPLAGSACSPGYGPVHLELIEQDIGALNKAKDKDYLRLHLPQIIGNNCDPNTFTKCQTLFASFGFQLDEFKSICNKQIMSFYRDSEIKHEASDFNEDNINDIESLVTYSNRLHNLMCRLLCNPEDYDSLRLFLSIINETPHWIRPDLSCGDSKWNPYIKLSWATLRASILALKVKRDVVTQQFNVTAVILESKIKEILLEVRFRCYASIDDNIKTLQWRTGGIKTLANVPAPAAELDRNGNFTISETQKISDEHSWSIIFREGKTVDDLIVTGSDGYVIARLERLVNLRMNGANLAEFQPYMHFNSKYLKSAEDKVNAANAHSIAIGNYEDEKGFLPNDCALVLMASKKVERALEFKKKL